MGSLKSNLQKILMSTKSSSTSSLPNSARQQSSSMQRSTSNSAMNMTSGSQLDAEEQQMFKIAHLAGVTMGTHSLKAIKSLCQAGCDPNDIVAAVEQISESYIQMKERSKKQKA